MGVESLNLVQRCRSSVRAIDGGLAKLGAVLVKNPTFAEALQREIVRDDYLIEFLVMREVDHFGLSMRTALCCDIRVVDRMADCARKLSALSGSSVWTVFGERIDIDVADPSAPEQLRAVFVRRRDHFFRGATGTVDIPPAPLRSDSACIDYVMSFAKPRE